MDNNFDCLTPTPNLRSTGFVQLADRDPVVFDLDGTVADTLPVTLPCFQEALAPSLGRTPTFEEILARFGPADHQIVARWVGPEEAEAAVRRLYDAYARASGNLQPFPGMIDLLRSLRNQGRRTALFTGRGRPSTEVVLGALGLQRWFDVTVTGEEVPRVKPAPDGLLLILERLGASRERAVYVGDTVKDVEAANAAGVTAVAAAWGSLEIDRLRDRDALLVHGVEELGRLLGAYPSG
jgi:HAD superfamily hydrolase (TIGR01509 family)